jgi:hypothetical protein
LIRGGCWGRGNWGARGAKGCQECAQGALGAEKKKISQIF